MLKVHVSFGKLKASFHHKLTLKGMSYELHTVGISLPSNKPKMKSPKQEVFGMD